MELVSKVIHENRGRKSCLSREHEQRGGERRGRKSGFDLLRESSASDGWECPRRSNHPVATGPQTRKQARKLLMTGLDYRSRRGDASSVSPRLLGTKLLYGGGDGGGESVDCCCLTSLNTRRRCRSFSSSRCSYLDKEDADQCNARF